MTRNERLAATFDGSFVVFMIGMRINNLLLAHKWWPVAMAMPRMIRELAENPELGFIHAEAWFGRTTIMVQYWRSLDQLLAYARNKEADHLPAWRAFNNAVGTNGSVGIWQCGASFDWKSVGRLSALGSNTKGTVGAYPRSCRSGNEPKRFPVPPLCEARALTQARPEPPLNRDARRRACARVGRRLAGSCTLDWAGCFGLD